MKSFGKTDAQLIKEYLQAKVRAVYGRNEQAYQFHVDIDKTAYGTAEMPRFIVTQTLDMSGSEPNKSANDLYAQLAEILEGFEVKKVPEGEQKLHIEFSGSPVLLKSAIEQGDGDFFSGMLKQKEK